MKKRTHEGRGGTIMTAEAPSSAEEIDLDRIVWDPEYRRAVKPLLSLGELGPEAPVKRPRRGD